MNFPIFLLLLISSFIPLCSEKIHGIISIFSNLLGLVLRPYMWSVTETLLCVLENAYSSVGWKDLYMSFRYIWSIGSLKSILSLFIFLSGCSIHYWMWGVEVSHYYCIAFSFSFQICQCWFYILRCSDIGCMYICNCCVIMLNWPFYHCVMTVFVSKDNFCLKINFTNKFHTLYSHVAV